MGTALPKQFLPLADRPILIRTLEAFWRFQDTLPIALVLPTSDFDLWEGLASTWLSPSHQAQLLLCEGGNSRCHSVYNGLQRLYQHIEKPSTCWAAIHDGVRPFVSTALLAEAYESAQTQGASVACVPVKATLRRKGSLGNSQTVDRSEYFEVQTPQTFRLDLIHQAFLKRPHDNFTDDASLYQDSGGELAICQGSYDNIKVTTPEDLELGELILKRLAGGP